MDVECNEVDAPATSSRDSRHSATAAATAPPGFHCAAPEARSTKTGVAHGRSDDAASAEVPRKRIKGDECTCTEDPGTCRMCTEVRKEFLAFCQKEYTLRLGKSYRWGKDNDPENFKKKGRQRLPELDRFCCHGFGDAPIREYHFGKFKQPQLFYSKATCLPTIVHATHFAAFVQMVEEGEKDGSEIKALHFQGKYGVQYRTNRKMIWGAAMPPADECKKNMKGHKGIRSNSYGRVVIHLDSTKLKDHLEDAMPGFSVYTLGTRAYVNEHCHTFVVAEGNSALAMPMPQGNQWPWWEKEVPADPTVLVLEKKEWPTSWTWRWDKSRFEQLDIAIAKDDLQIPLSVIEKIVLLSEKQHNNCIRNGCWTENCLERRKDEKNEKALVAWLEELRKQGVRVEGLDEKPKPSLLNTTASVTSDGAAAAATVAI